jgi:cell division protein FtsZ
MSYNYESSPYSVKIKVIGVGSGGINAVAGMLSKLEGVEFWAIDTDVINSIDLTPIPNALTLRDKSEWESKFSTALKGADLVFLVAGMGGENGLDVMMEVARVSKQVIGALTVGVVTVNHNI